MILGRTIAFWMTSFNSCFNLTQTGFSQWCWPDGGSLMSQDNILVEVFTLIKSESEVQISKKMKNGR